VQLSHKRAANAAWKLKAAGLFGKGKQLTVEATRAVRKGEAIVMDYGPDKLDNTLLLDYGIIDASFLKARPPAGCLMHHCLWEECSNRCCHHAWLAPS
jgi:hypothetical protein